MTIPILLAGAVAGLISGSSLDAAARPAELPPHPRLLFNRPDIAAIQQRIATQPWAKSHFDSMRKEADDWLAREIKLPDRGGQWYHYYSCPKHGARLRTEGPTRHVCPVDGEVLTGYPYDDVVLMGDHNRLASGLRTLGIVHQLTGDARYAAKAKEILLAYAARYESYPLHTTKGEAKVGGGKVGPQTLDESTWLITVLEGADCIWETLNATEKATVTEKLLYPATKIIRQHRMGIHNIQCWKNSAVGLTGLLLGDTNLVHEALHGPSGYFNQMSKGISADGAWYEGAWGYHFYTVSAVVHLTEGALHCGIDLYGDAFKRMFDAPLAMAMPDLTLPAFNDSYAVSLRNQAGLYETALARYHDDRYRLLVARSGRSSDAALLHGVDDAGRAPEFVASSRNFPASGYAILAAGSGTQATWFCIDYGPHGGGHGHPDKLGFVLYGLGQVLAPDPGTANYGVPIQGGWFRTTLAHNTLVVDEQSQKAAEGKCEAFLATNSFSAVMASAGPIAEGVSFHRTVTLLGDNLLAFLDQIRADKEHTFDLVYHNVGRLTAPPGATPSDLPDKPGYKYLRDAKRLESTKGLQLDFGAGSGRNVRWVMASGEPITFITGTGVGAHTEDRVPLVIAQRHAKETAYAWCVSLGSAPAELQWASARVTAGEGQQPNAVGVAMVEITTPVGRHLLLANPAGGKITVSGQVIEGKIVHLVPGDDATLRVQNTAR